VSQRKRLPLHQSLSVIYFVEWDLLKTSQRGRVFIQNPSRKSKNILMGDNISVLDIVMSKIIATTLVSYI
jgi:hypothetical protein